MTYCSAAPINTQVQPGGKASVAGKPFQRLSAESKTVEPVCRSCSWLQVAEASVNEKSLGVYTKTNR
jgi:hypothetical protein